MRDIKIDQSNALAEVAKIFEDWRMTRAKHSRIPAKLRALITPLKTDYNTSQITRALKISRVQLQQVAQWGELTPIPAQAPFVECAVKPTVPTNPTQGITLSFNCKNGYPVTVSGLHSADMAYVLSTLMGAPV